MSPRPLVWAIGYSVIHLMDAGAPKELHLSDDGEKQS